MSSYTDKDLAPPAALSLPKPRSSVNEEDGQKAKSAPKVDKDGIPELSTMPATDTDSRVEALHMVADSVAQQRNIGSRTLIYHPITLAIFVAVLAALQRYFTVKGQTDYIKVCTTMTGIAMTIFVMIRWACGGYIDEAEKVGTWKWLNRGRSTEEEEVSGQRAVGENDEILLTQFGEEYIGTIVFRGVQPTNSSSSSPTKRSRKSQSSANQTKMQIRAWTVAQKYRRKGVGAALLQDALQIGHEKGWIAGGVEFAEDHANSKRILPGMLNGGFEKYDRIARKILDTKLSEFEAGLDNKGRRKR